MDIGVAITEDMVDTEDMADTEDTVAMEDGTEDTDVNSIFVLKR